jgi:hypothetical protein
MRLLSPLAGAVVCATVAFGQTQPPVFPFQLRIQQDDNVATVPNNASVALFAGNLRSSVTLRLTATYRGNTSVTFNQQPELFGSPDFRIVSFPVVPVRLEQGGSVELQVQFTASTSRTVTGQVNLNYLEAPPTGIIPIFGQIGLSLTGSAPEFTVSYALSTDANLLALPPDSVLNFAPTLVNTATSATVLILNRGSGPGRINAINVTGSAFQPLGLPLVPFGLDAGRDLRFTIRYTPKQIEESTGTLRIEFADQTFNVTLKGTATGSNFSYEFLQGDDVQPLAPNGSISMPDTQVGQTASGTLRMRNIGNGDGPVTSINLIGPGFLLSDVPFLPQVLAPNAALLFTLNFTPSQAGPARARLRIGNDSFEINAVGIGPRLLFSYANATATSDVLPGGSVVFSPVAVGQSARIVFKVKNAGTAATNVSNIGIVENRSPFEVAELPPFPASLDPGADMEFAIVFRPQLTGFTAGTLRIDNVPFVLSGSGTAPPPLPEARFDGPQTVQPLDQPGYRLTLAQPYPLALSGTVTLTINADPFLPDNAVSFATGGRILPFTIVANSAEAVFANGSNQLRFQAGSVASVINLTTAIATTGGLVLTPEPAPVFRVSVAGGAPRLLGALIANRTTNSFVLAVNGIAPSLDLTRFEVEFTPAAGVNLPTTRVTVEVAELAANWFRISQAQGLGSQFSATIPFTLRTETPTQTLPPESLQSLSVTAVGTQGRSNPMRATF